MNDAARRANERRLEADLHDHLERALRATAWRSGAAEAHGLVSALACRGVRAEQVRAKAWLLQCSAASDLELLEGLHGLTLRALQADGFEFKLLLPETDGCARRIEALANWCGGFLQGFLHDDADRLDRLPPTVREPLDDILRLSRIDLHAHDGVEAERQAIEVEEYLRVAAQTIFDAMTAPDNATQPDNSQRH
ncbi:MAG: UPF0149 family protein [bacterium]